MAKTEAQPLLNELEARLLRLALCPGAAEGEVTNSAVALISSWRRRGLRPEALFESNKLPSLPAPPVKTGIDPRSVPMPFGKFRGIPLGYVKRSYLRWALRNCHDMQPGLRHAIELVLNS